MLNGAIALGVLGIPVASYLYRTQYHENPATLRYLESHYKKVTALHAQQIPISVLRTVEEVESFFQRLLATSGVRVCSLDAEWKPNQIKGESPHPVAILQVATPTEVGIVQLLPLDHMPPSLQEFLKDPTFLKVGVGIFQDARKLYRDHKLTLRGTVEIGGIAQKVDPDHRGGNGLKSLVYYFAQLTLPKNKQIQLSDWSVSTLSADQIFYATADAWGGLLLFESLLRLAFLTSGRCIDYWWQETQHNEWIQQWLQHNLDQKAPQKKSHPTDGGAEQGKKDREAYRAKKHADTSFNEEACRKSPLYDGCQMIAPDGSHISYCNKDKVQWYLEKELADLIPDTDPMVIRLKFFPSGATGSEAVGFRASETMTAAPDTVNRCVICGMRDSYQRYLVVPRCYRQHFPPNAKFHCSHDIVLLCPSCHFRCSAEANKFKENEIAKRYQVPVAGKGSRFADDPVGRRVAWAARDIKQKRETMSAEELADRESIIREYFQISEEDMTEDHISKAAGIHYRQPNPNYIPHGEAVVQQMDNDPVKLQHFTFLWRKFFEETLQPKYLPPYWDLNHEWEEQHGSGQRITPYYS